MRDTFSRRRVLRRASAAVVGLGGLAGSAAGTGEAEAERTDSRLLSLLTDDEGAERIPLLDVAGPLEAVAPAALPEQAAGITPGSQLFVERETGSAACSANFVWRDATDGRLYLGAAGHCFLQDAPAAEGIADGEGDDVSDLSVLVNVDATFGGVTGQSLADVDVVELGDVVYARQAEPGGGAGIGHDFGLVEIPPEAEGLVDPSVPQFGGPDGVIRDGAVPTGSPVVQYGAGVVNGEVFLTQGRRGLSLGSPDGYRSWSAVLRATPGDSGSALLGVDESLTSLAGGPAAGVLTHISTSGIAGTTVQRCIEMPAEDGLDLDLEVVQP